MPSKNELEFASRRSPVYGLGGMVVTSQPLAVAAGLEGLADNCPQFHPYTITVPGACAGWCDLLAHHGRLPIIQVLTPAIRLAEEGFPVAPITAFFWGRSAKRLSNALGGIERSEER